MPTEWLPYPSELKVAAVRRVALDCRGRMCKAPFDMAHRNHCTNYRSAYGYCAWEGELETSTTVHAAMEVHLASLQPMYLRALDAYLSHTVAALTFLASSCSWAVAVEAVEYYPAVAHGSLGDEIFASQVEVNVLRHWGNAKLQAAAEMAGLALSPTLVEVVAAGVERPYARDSRVVAVLAQAPGLETLLAR